MLKRIKKLITISIVLSLAFEQSGFAQVVAQLNVPAYLQNMPAVTDHFRPIHLRSVSIDPATNNFDLLLDKGDTKQLQREQIEETTRQLMAYFRIALILPNSMFWVNLRPDAPADIIDPYVERTDIGRIMLEADLQLKKDMARFTSPNTPEGRQYWNKLYQKAESLYGNNDMEIPTLTRPWIVPGEIIMGDSKDGAYIYKATLKVMLEQDYIKDTKFYSFNDERAKQLNDYSTEIIRQIILPKLTREVNASKRYAGLRQVYYSLILAQWYKSGYRSGKGSAIKIDTKELNGLTSKNAWSKEEYYKAYRESFNKGEYNIEETVHSRGNMVVRQYFSGGLAFENVGITARFPSREVFFTGFKESFDSLNRFLERVKVILNPDGTEEVRRVEIESDVDNKSARAPKEIARDSTEGIIAMASAPEGSHSNTQTGQKNDGESLETILKDARAGDQDSIGKLREAAERDPESFWLEVKKLRYNRKFVESLLNGETGPRKLAVIVYPVSDWNGGLEDLDHHVEELEKQGYLVKYTRVETVNEAVDFIKESTKEQHASVLILGGHGRKNELQFTDTEDFFAKMPYMDSILNRVWAINEKIEEMIKEFPGLFSDPEKDDVRGKITELYSAYTDTNYAAKSEAVERLIEKKTKEIEEIKDSLERELKAVNLTLKGWEAQKNKLVRELIDEEMVINDMLSNNAYRALLEKQSKKISDIKARIERLRQSQGYVVAENKEFELLKQISLITAFMSLMQELKTNREADIARLREMEEFHNQSSLSGNNADLFADVAERLKKNAVVMLFSCSTGKEDEPGDNNNLISIIANTLKGRKVLAPFQDASGMQIIFDEDGTPVDLRYIKNKFDDVEDKPDLLIFQASLKAFVRYLPSAYDRGFSPDDLVSVNVKQYDDPPEGGGVTPQQLKDKIEKADSGHENARDFLKKYAADNPWLYGKQMIYLKYSPDEIEAYKDSGATQAKESEQPVVKENSSAEKRGGIDFRALPVPARPAEEIGIPSGLNAQMQLDPKVAQALDKEWLAIRQQVQNGPVPYQKIKELVASCKAQGAGEEMQKVLVCISEILRMEEERAVETAPELKEIMASIFI